MNTRCKVGDMGIVVGTPGIPETTHGLLGRVVEIIRPHVAETRYPSINGGPISMRESHALSWVVRSSTPLPWTVVSGPNTGATWMFTERPILDSSIIPISGVPVDEDVTEDLKEPA